MTLPGAVRLPSSRGFDERERRDRCRRHAAARAALPVALAWVLFWLLMIAIAVDDHWRRGGAPWWQPLPWEGSSCLVATVERHAAFALSHNRLVCRDDDVRVDRTGPDRT
jgi:hypothetical protein